MDEFNITMRDKEVFEVKTLKSSNNYEKSNQLSTNNFPIKNRTLKNIENIQELTFEETIERVHTPTFNQRILSDSNANNKSLRHTGPAHSYNNTEFIKVRPNSEGLNSKQTSLPQEFNQANMSQIKNEIFIPKKRLYRSPIYKKREDHDGEAPAVISAKFESQDKPVGAKLSGTPKSQDLRSQFTKRDTRTFIEPKREAFGFANSQLVSKESMVIPAEPKIQTRKSKSSQFTYHLKKDRINKQYSANKHKMDIPSESKYTYSNAPQQNLNNKNYSGNHLMEKVYVNNYSFKNSQSSEVDVPAENFVKLDQLIDEEDFTGSGTLENYLQGDIRLPDIGLQRQYPLDPMKAHLDSQQRKNRYTPQILSPKNSFWKNKPMTYNNGQRPKIFL